MAPSHDAIQEVCSDEHAEFFLSREALVSCAATSAVLMVYAERQQTPTTAAQQAAQLLPIRAVAARAFDGAC
jgi:hypothetical protein